MILPQSALVATKGVDPVAQALTQAVEPFTWAYGGLKMTPQQAAMLREQGMARSRGDYSPIQHWTQGLARVADNVMGALDARRADRELAAGAEADRALMEAMVGGQVDDSMIARALMDPNVGQGVKEFAGMEYAARRPKQQAPLEVERLAMLANDPTAAPYVREAAAAKLRNQNDPLITTTLPGDRFYSGPQSGLAAALGGGDPASGAPSSAVPPEAVADLMADPSPQALAEFDEAFGQGSAERVLGGQASAPDPFPAS